MSCLVLSCLVLSCLVSSRLVLSSLVWSCLDVYVPWVVLASWVGRRHPKVRLVQLGPFCAGVECRFFQCNYGFWHLSGKWVFGVNTGFFLWVLWVFGNKGRFIMEVVMVEMAALGPEP